MYVFGLSYVQLMKTDSDNCGSRVMSRHLPDNLHNRKYPNSYYGELRRLYWKNCLIIENKAPFSHFTDKMSVCKCISAYIAV